MKVSRTGSLCSLLLIGFATACSDGETRESGPPQTSTTASEERCDEGVLSATRKIRKVEAEAIAGKSVKICEVGSGTDGSQDFTQSTLSSATTAEQDFAARIAYDGDPIASGCSISRSSRLFLRVGNEWAEGRQVGCGSDS